MAACKALSSFRRTRLKAVSGAAGRSVAESSPRRATALWLNQSGASAIEFALIVPVLVLFVVGMIDLTRLAQSDYFLTKAAARTVELALNKGAIDNEYDYLKAEAAAAAGVSADKVTIDYWLECNYVRKKDFHGSCPNGDLPFRYVSVEITSDYRSIFPSGVLPALASVSGTALARVQ